MRSISKWVVCAASASCLVCASDAFSQTIVNGSPGENLRNMPLRRPGLLVESAIAAHVNGLEITLTDDPGPEYRVLLLDEFVRNLFAQLNVFITFLPSLLNPGDVDPGGGGGGGSVGGLNDIVMTEVAHNGSVAFVELFNRNPLRTSLAGWHFSDGENVSPSLPPFLLERNETLVIQLGGETQRADADLILGFRLQSLSAGELALFDFSGVTDGTFPVENSDLMVDYIQWNDSDTRRDPPLESVAAQANLWTAIDAIPVSLADMTFRLAADAEGRNGTSSRNIITGPFEESTLGMPESEVVTPTVFKGRNELDDGLR